MNWPAELLRDPAGLELVRTLAGDDPIDIDTARLYRQIVESDRFFPLLPAGASRSISSECLILVMPGAFHTEHPHTGADGQRVLDLAAGIGCEAVRVPIGSFEPMRVNATVLIDTLRRYADRRIVLVSLSKGGADVKTALGLSPEAFAPVRLWLSFSGLLSGTPLVRWLRARRLRWLGVRCLLWWKRHSIGALTELEPGPGSPLGGWPAMPGHLKLVQIMGVPLRRHLCHRWAPRGYERLASHGPNDGGALLLADALAGPGSVYPVWGADHYLQPAWDLSPLLRSLLATALHEMNA